MKNVFIIGGARTPVGEFGGGLREQSPEELGVTASRGALNNGNVKTEDIDHVFVGNVIPTSESAAYLARHLALKAGIPTHVPALTVNRLCGSGLQAVISAAQTILLGDGETVLALGTESMSKAPILLHDTRFGSKLKTPEMGDMLMGTLTDAYAGCGMGMTAENLAEKYGITRKEQDEFAFESQQKASNARDEGRWAKEIVPVIQVDRKGTERVIREDEFIKPNTTVEKLSTLRPSFKKDGTVTAGNTSGISDGAAAVIVASETYLNRNTLAAPLARIVSWGISGVDPQYMGIGPVPASLSALKKAGLNKNDIDLFEINEAFAAQYLAVEKELRLDRIKVNVNGGSIALGHPVGASGARILYSLALELKYRGLRYGLASLCIGGGQGISIIIESV